MDRQTEFVLRSMEERGIRFVRLWFTDVLGSLKSVAIAPTEVEGAIAEGVGFDGSAIEGFARLYESDMVAHPEFPCLGARSVFRRDAATVVVLDDLESELSRTELSRALAEYGRTADPTGAFVSFVAVFRGPQIRDEEHFERLLWDLLQRLHDEDEEPWAHGVDDDPDKAHFAYSHAGVAYFIVGLHPQASRIARRAPLPTLVFNLHEQFELLRGEGIDV